MLDGHFIDPADAADQFDEIDFVMVYCPQCHERIEFPIVHSTAAGNYHQAVNIPNKIAMEMKWDPSSIFCDICNHYLVVEKQYEEPKRVELTVRVNTPRKQTMRTSWYDDVGGQYLG